MKQRKRTRTVILGTIMAMMLVGLLAFGDTEVQAARRNGWVTTRGKTFYYENGVKHKGWLTLKGKKYFFNTVNGIQKKGWVKNAKGERRYFDKKTGALTTGWKKYGGKRRFFNKKTGVMYTGLYRMGNGKYRYFHRSTGYMYTGLVKHGKYYYYYEPKTGFRFQGGMKRIGKNTYYFDKKTGRAHTGWLTINGKKYCFNGKTAVMYRDTTATISRKKYTFNSRGESMEIGANRWEQLLKNYQKDKSVNQLIFVKYEGGSRATVMMYERRGNRLIRTLNCRGYVGQNGIDKVQAGDRKTPTGTFGFTKAFGIRNNPGTKIPYTKLNPYLYWCADKSNYNTMIDVRKKPHACHGEHLISYNPQYNYALALDFNSERIYGKGSAIFLHCAGSYGYTGGCVSVSQENMIKIMRAVDRGAKICIYPK